MNISDKWKPIVDGRISDEPVPIALLLEPHESRHLQKIIELSDRPIMEEIIEDLIKCSPIEVAQYIFEGMIDIKCVAQTCAEDYWHNHDGWEGSEQCCYTVVFSDPQNENLWYECDVELEHVMMFTPSLMSLKPMTKAEAIGAENE